MTAVFTASDIVVVALGMAMMVIAVVHAMRRRQVQGDDEALAGRELGPWVLGLSAGATANTGFVLTGAVGMGVSFGLAACMLPVAWFLGDLVFWYFLAHRINERSRQVRALTLPSLLQRSSSTPEGGGLRAGGAIVLFALLVLYLGAQWLSVGKIATVLFDIDLTLAIVAFALVVALYTALSGFRGAVYTDVVQAIFMIALAAAACWLTVRFAGVDGISIVSSRLLRDAGEIGLGALLAALGFAAAALGFDLGQPQMVTRWMAGRNADVLKRARWIYMSFLQATWLSFTLVGVVLGHVMSSSGAANDSEQAMVRLFAGAAIPGMLGLLVVGSFSTIASSAASGLAVSAEMLRLDLFKAPRFNRHLLTAVLVAFTAACSVGVSLFSGGSVFDLAFASVSLTGAAFGAVVLYLALGRRYSALHAGIAIGIGIVAGVAWKLAGLSGSFNEAGAGLAAGLLAMGLLGSRRSAVQEAQR